MITTSYFYLKIYQSYSDYLLYNVTNGTNVTMTSVGSIKSVFINRNDSINSDASTYTWVIQFSSYVENGNYIEITPPVSDGVTFNANN